MCSFEFSKSMIWRTAIFSALVSLSAVGVFTTSLPAIAQQPQPGAAAQPAPAPMGNTNLQVPAGPQAAPTPVPITVTPQVQLNQPQSSPPPQLGPDGLPVFPTFGDPLSPPPGFPGAQEQGGGDSQVVPTVPPTVTTSEIIDVQKPVEKKKIMAIFRTSMGNFTVQLFTREAPRTTQHFIDLARGEKEFTDVKTGRKTRRPFYNGLILHRVVRNFIIQGGCPFGNGRGGPGFALPDEFNQALRHRRPFMFSMASANKTGDRGGYVREPNTIGSQFMITLRPAPEFDDQYTIIGEVVQGTDVIRDIARIRVGPTDRPVKRITIIAVDIVEE